MRLRLAALSVVLAALAAVGAAVTVASAGAQPEPMSIATPVKRPARPLIVGHRGAPAYRPEHTLSSYQMAIDLGADYIEPDIVATRDGHLIARHESDLRVTTDVITHAELGGRWRAEDLTLAEVRTLRTVGGLPVPTLDEVVELVRRQHRPVGLYVELKAPARFRALGLAIEERIAAALGQVQSPVFVQSFDPESLVRMRQLTAFPLVQLITGLTSLSAGDLDRISGYAAAIGVDRSRFPDCVTAPQVPRPTPWLVTEARARGLGVHVFTFAAGDPQAVYRSCYRTGATAMFTDAPDVAKAALS